jgi:hypothetical protein
LAIDQESISFIDPPTFPSRCETGFQIRMGQSNDRYGVQQHEFDTFNAKTSQDKSDSHQQHKLNKEIIRNLNPNMNREAKTENYSSMLISNMSYETEAKESDANHTVPLIYTNSKANGIDSGEMRTNDIPHWTTGVQRMPTFEAHRSSTYSNNYEQRHDNVLNQIFHKLDQFEHRLNSTDEKIRISKEINELKTDEKVLKTELGIYITHNRYRKREI